MKSLIIASLFFIAISAHGAVLKQRSYTFTTTSTAFTCVPGVKANGHNYPTSTEITFPTEYGASGIYSPSKIPLNNTDSVLLRDSTAQPCSAYSALLQSSVELNGQATQVFSEKTMRTAAGECFKSVREDLIIVVHGYTLQGSQVMYVPADDSDCQ